MKSTQAPDDRPVEGALEGIARTDTPIGAFLRHYRESAAFTQEWRCEHCGHLNRHTFINCESCERLPSEAA